MFNRVILIGRVGRDADFQMTSKGTGVARFSLATRRRWRDKDGNWQDDVQWHNIAVIGQHAQRVKERAKTGVLLMIEGEIRYNKWIDKESGNQRTRPEIIALRVVSLERRETAEGIYEETIAGEPGTEEPNIPFAPDVAESSEAETEDNLPF